MTKVYIMMDEIYECGEEKLFILLEYLIRSIKCMGYSCAIK